MSAIITAALPQSFARLDNSCRSREILSTTASMAEFRSSTSNTSSTDEISNTRSSGATGTKRAQGSRITASAASWRNALSERKVATMPLQECRSANQARSAPLRFGGSGAEGEELVRWLMSQVFRRARRHSVRGCFKRSEIREVCHKNLLFSAACARRRGPESRSARWRGSRYPSRWDFARFSPRTSIRECPGTLIERVPASLAVSIRCDLPCIKFPSELSYITNGRQGTFALSSVCPPQVVRQTASPRRSKRATQLTGIQSGRQ